MKNFDRFGVVVQGANHELSNRDSAERVVAGGGFIDGAVPNGQPTDRDVPERKAADRQDSPRSAH